MPDLGDIGSALAALVAIAALIYTGVIHRRQNAQARQQVALQTRMVAIEEDRDARALEDRQRADMVARLDVDEGALILVNQGPAAARQVRCTAAPIDANNELEIVGLESLPDVFQPGQHEEFDVRHTLTPARIQGEPISPLLRVVISWTDGMGKRETEYLIRVPY